VYAGRSPTGGYQLLDGYRTKLTGLTSNEADSLFLAGMPGPAAELELGMVVATAELKLLAALPAELRARAGRIRERFHLDAPGWSRKADEVPHLAQVADAVWNQWLIDIRYRRWATPREVTRQLAPLGVVLKAGTWYLVALGGADLRTYRVSNVLAVEQVEERMRGQRVTFGCRRPACACCPRSSAATRRARFYPVRPNRTRTAGSKLFSRLSRCDTHRLSC
jgi:predicted DNA-binding transcriptional regulator YafY